MTATQVQARRGTAAQCDAMTPAAGEFLYDTTNDELRIGDGSKQGGWRVPNFQSLQNQTMVSVDATGTGDAQEIDVSPRPSAYAAYQSFVAKAVGTNTVTNPSLDVMGAAGSLLGAVQIKKKTSAGLSVLAPGDIQSGCFYRYTHTGTFFQVDSVDIPPPSGMAVLKDEVFAGVAQVDFVNLFSAAYASYDWEIDLLPATDNTFLHLLTTANGSTWDTGATDYAYDNAGDNIGLASSADTAASTGDAKILLGGINSVGNASGEGLQARIGIINPLGTTRQKIFQGGGNHVRTNGNQQRWTFNGKRSATAALAGVRFKMSSGNMTGRIRMRGYI